MLWLSGYRFNWIRLPLSFFQNSFHPKKPLDTKQWVIHLSLIPSPPYNAFDSNRSQKFSSNQCNWKYPQIRLAHLCHYRNRKNFHKSSYSPSPSPNKSRPPQHLIRGRDTEHMLRAPCALMEKNHHPAAQVVRGLPAVQETSVWLLGREDPLEKGYATHSGILGLPWWLRW